ncbi:MAG: DUF1667 domain-containing protein [Spirochaetaceae bacterium]|jgi:CxxC motif-containing protein|nr:DUF1667 domain-containing protein [Spirochaetaceae bacterium]
MTREIICISCPIGCHLSVSFIENDDIQAEDIDITGNKCPRGLVYGREEILSPKRVVTATCAVSSVYMGRIPVKTTGPLLKYSINPLLEDLYKIRLTPPVSTGDTIIENFMNSGINVIATRSLSK